MNKLVTIIASCSIASIFLSAIDQRNAMMWPAYLILGASIGLLVLSL